MSLLLDTCTFLWLIGMRGALSATALEAITDPNRNCFLSSASLWEILVKHRAGRLVIECGNQAVDRFLVDQRLAHGIDPLPIDEDAVSQLTRIPDHHRDPFDRILVCQAVATGLALVTPDEAIRRYPVRTIW